MSVKLCLIAAVAKNGMIGSANDMPWGHGLSSDLKRFRALTMGKPIIMGRKTFYAIGKALDGRDNLVITRDDSFSEEGVYRCATIDDALVKGQELAEARGVDEMMVVGGGQIYSATIDRADRLYITQVDAEPEGDTRFPHISSDDWSVSHREEIPRTDKDFTNIELITYERK
ncbi:dihydrofolate reductase [Coralliovum pocilloporae]|uniref:dihydrofolate reductase n=1 Tax=Coralliovum pocilloporae TaxID=3066369 RepID=UPI00330780DF